MKVTVIMEKASDGYYSCFVEEDLPGFGLAGYGDTAEAAKEDMMKAYEEIKEMHHICNCMSVFQLSLNLLAFLINFCDFSCLRV